MFRISVRANCVKTGELRGYPLDVVDSSLGILGESAVFSRGQTAWNRIVLLILSGVTNKSFIVSPGHVRCSRLVQALQEV